MDLKLYARVLSGHRTLLLVGLAAAVLLAGLSYYRVASDGGLPKLTPRKAELWQSQANVFLTEGGFPAGRRTIPLTTKVVGGEVITVPEYNDPGRFAGLASLYARLAQSDEVRALIEEDGPLPGEFQAVPTVDPTTRIAETLPMVSLFGKATTAARAEATVTRGLEAFLSYMRAQQQAAEIPPGDRVDLRVLNAPQPAILIQPRKKTLPVVVFLAVLIATIAAAFILENARTSRKLVASVEGLEQISSPTPSPTRTVSPAPEREPESESEPEPVAPARRWA